MDRLFSYYEKELRYLFKLGEQFAKKHGKVAEGLLLEPERCQDPHVERLLEGFAFLAARIHLRLDQDLSFVSSNILDLVVPDLLRPIPSVSIVQFVLDSINARFTEAFRFPAGSILRSEPVDGVICAFRTAYGVDLWPIEISDSQFMPISELRLLNPPVKASQAIRIRISPFDGVALSQLKLGTMRLHLSGDILLVNTLYELLNTKLTRILVRDVISGVVLADLPGSSLRPVGFDEPLPSEGRVESAQPKQSSQRSWNATEPWLFTTDGRSFPGYQLLKEFFAFPDKFFFLDLVGLENVWAQTVGAVDVIFALTPLESDEARQRLFSVGKATFRLNCAPIVNLFDHACEPILKTSRQSEFPIEVSRQSAAHELYAITRVRGIEDATNLIHDYEPFFSPRERGGDERRYWVTRRSESGEISIAFVDAVNGTAVPDGDTIDVRVLAMNGDLPFQLKQGASLNVDVSAPVRDVVLLSRPSRRKLPPAGVALQWDLVSHLSLNYLSMVDSGLPALKLILSLYDWGRSRHRLIDGLLSLKGEMGFARISSPAGVSFARGWNIDVEIGEEPSIGGGRFLFAAVLERFLGAYAALNSFTQLTFRDHRGEIKRWQPRAGRRILA